MSLCIQLLGTPTVEGTDSGIKARGRKTWAVLAYLLLATDPPSRGALSELLFADADDPLGALRWTLADVRRLLGEAASIEGDPIRLALPPDAVVDVDVLTRGPWAEAIRLPTLGRDLIEGRDRPWSPGFELWLTAERRRLGGVAESVLREATLSSLADREPAGALEHATRLVRLNPYDENHHVLLVRSMADLGDHEGAMQQVERSAELLRLELGLDAEVILRAAAAAQPVVRPSSDAPATVRALREAGEAAIGAGALETGLGALRGAVSGSRAGGDRRLLAETLIELGSTLVHAARGTDEEGAAALYEGRTLADQLPDHDLGAKARRELAWIEFLRGRYDRALAWSAEAGRLAGRNDTELAWVDLIAGGCHTDRGDYGAALPVLTSAVDRAERTGAARPAAVALALVGRWHLLRGETEPARPALGRSLEHARSDGWTAFLPWPESLRAELDLRNGDVEAATVAFEHAFALGCQVGDPCWESVAARGLGLIAAAKRDQGTAIDWLTEAARRGRRLPDAWLWMEAYALDALCAVAVASGDPAASRWVGELEVIAGRAGMRELLARAMLHRARLGDRAALDAARALAARIDNPALDAEVAAAG